MMGQNPVTPKIDGLAQAAEAAKTRDLPPVDRWDPPFSGDIDIRIARDGTWYHEGGEIRRAGLVRLFSSILRKDGDDYVLVTPAEKWRITVEDAPFVAVDVDATGQGAAQCLRFVTQTGDHMTPGPDVPLWVDLAEDGTPSPYVRVRRNLDALIDRKTFYRLADLAVEQDGQLGVWSDGMFFPLGPSDPDHSA